MATGVWTVVAFDTGGCDWSGSILILETQAVDKEKGDGEI